MGRSGSKQTQIQVKVAYTLDAEDDARTNLGNIADEDVREQVFKTKAIKNVQKEAVWDETINHFGKGYVTAADILAKCQAAAHTFTVPLRAVPAILDRRLADLDAEYKKTRSVPLIRA